MSEFKMPKMDHLSEESTIIKWLKKEGEAVTKGDLIVTIETGKAVLDVESPLTGTITKIVVEENSEVPIGTVIAYID